MQSAQRKTNKGPIQPKDHSIIPIVNYFPRIPAIGAHRKFNTKIISFHIDQKVRTLQVLSFPAYTKCIALHG